MVKKNKMDWRNLRTTEIEKKEYYLKSIKPLIHKGLTFIKMEKAMLIKCSAPTAKKFTVQFGSSEDLEQSKQNTAKAKGHGKSKGVSSKLKGKTYEEILGKTKAIERSAITSKWMKERNIRKHCTKISKPQKMLYELIKEYFPTAVLEYKIQIDKSKFVFLDIAILECKLNIEYDGTYWHNKNNESEKSFKDSKRDELLKEMGWTIYRFRFESNPPLEELILKAKEYKLIKI